MANTYVVIDLETTGLDNSYDKTVSYTHLPQKFLPPTPSILMLKQ